ncbi:MAG: ABC transporter permease, partial [Flexistipes sinusarabici]
MRLLVFIYKELLQFIRNKGLFIFVIYLFTADLYIAANGIDLTLKNAKFYVVDEDMSVISRQMVSEFTEPWFNFQGYLQEENKTESLLMRDMAVGIIVIPEDFSKSIKSGKTSEIAMFINGTESTSGYLFSGYATRIINNFVINYTRKTDSARDPPVINIRERFLYNPNADSKIFMTITELFSVI